MVVQPLGLITWRKTRRGRSELAFADQQQPWIERTAGRDRSGSWEVPLSQSRSPFHGLDRTAPRRDEVNVIRSGCYTHVLSARGYRLSFSSIHNPTIGHNCKAALGFD